ncbi:MAG: hypothetical protein HZLCBSQH_001161 [Candidatus Fervidibacterota bacterium]
MSNTSDKLFIVPLPLQRQARQAARPTLCAAEVDQTLLAPFWWEGLMEPNAIPRWQT